MQRLKEVTISIRLVVNVEQTTGVPQNATVPGHVRDVAL